MNDFVRRAREAITDPEQAAMFCRSVATKNAVREATERVRNRDLRRGDTIMGDDGSLYRVERVRRNWGAGNFSTDMELTLTGSIRTFPFSAFSHQYTNRVPRS